MKSSFHFLREIDSNTYIETYGVDFEDFEPGQIFEHRPGKTLLAEDCVSHALRSLDLNPRHADRHFAGALYGDNVPVMETYILSLLAMTTKTFGKVVANLSIIDFEMKPVYAGDTLYFESEILTKRESASRPDQGILHIATRGINQHGEQVCAFERKLLIYRQGHGPYTQAGY